MCSFDDCDRHMRSGGAWREVYVAVRTWSCSRANGPGRSRLPARVLDEAAGARRIADDEEEANPAQPANGERGLLTPDDTRTLTAANCPQDDASSGNDAASPARRLAPGAQVGRYEVIGLPKPALRAR
jgi:hypothetical protein